LVVVVVGVVVGVGVVGVGGCRWRYVVVVVVVVVASRGWSGCKRRRRENLDARYLAYLTELTTSTVRNTVLTTLPVCTVPIVRSSKPECVYACFRGGRKTRSRLARDGSKDSTTTTTTRTRCRVVVVVLVLVVLVLVVVAPWLFHQNSAMLRGTLVSSFRCYLPPANRLLRTAQLAHRRATMYGIQLFHTYACSLKKLCLCVADAAG
jgi:hypothetical protein